jgi:putative hydrolase of the HAD superfamily
MAEVNKQLVSEYITPLQPIRPAISPGGTLGVPVRAVVFDIYGTLFISASGENTMTQLAPSRRPFLHRLLIRYGLPSGIEQLLNDLQREINRQHDSSRQQGIAYPEVDMLQIWRQVLPLEDPEDIRRFGLEFEFIVNPVYPMPHLARFLTDCARRVSRMGIISNAQFYTPYLFEWLLGADLDQLGFDPELVLLSYRLGLAKPSPELFRQTADQLARSGIDPAEAVYVGNDMRKDIDPASDCGFQTALFAGDRRSLRLHRDAPRCSRREPDLIITELDQLLPHLGGRKEWLPSY